MVLKAAHEYVNRRQTFYICHESNPYFAVVQPVAKSRYRLSNPDPYYIFPHFLIHAVIRWIILLFFLFSIAKGSIQYGVIRAYRFWSTVNPLNFVRKKIMSFSVQDQRVRFAGFSLQNEHHQIPAATKAPTHNELGTRRPMW